MISMFASTSNYSEVDVLLSTNNIDQPSSPSKEGQLLPQKPQQEASTPTTDQKSISRNSSDSSLTNAEETFQQTSISSTKNRIAHLRTSSVFTETDESSNYSDFTYDEESTSSMSTNGSGNNKKNSSVLNSKKFNFKTFLRSIADLNGDVSEAEATRNHETQKQLIEEALERKKRRLARLKREEFLGQSQQFFKQTVLNQEYETARMLLRKDSRVRKMWRQGLPPQVRGLIWQLAIGNELRITKDLYSILKAKKIEPSKEQYPEDPNRLDLFNREHTINLIKIDLSRTFPALQFFQEGGPMYNMLKEVLEVYCKFRPDIGYVQGMSYLVCMLLLYMDDYSAFVCLANMLNQGHFYSFFRMNTTEISKHVECFKIIMKSHVPKLYNHLVSHLQINCQIFLIDWLFTLFCKSLPLDISARMWDLYFCNGEASLYACALALLRYFETNLLKADFDEAMYLLTHISNYHDQMDELKLFVLVDMESKAITDSKLQAAKQQAAKIVQSQHL